MKKEKRELIKNYAQRYALITLGCILYPVGVVLFLQAGGIAGGGVTGIALILNEVTGASTGLLSFIINVPLLIWGWKAFGREFFFSTLYVIMLTSLLTLLCEFIFFDALPAQYGLTLLPLTDNMLINAVAGGAIFGLGMGLIFRCGSSSGGTDIPVKILKKKFRHMRTGVITLITDVAIVGCSVFAYQNNKLETLFFTILSVVVFTVVFDWILYGGN